MNGSNCLLLPRVLVALLLLTFQVSSYCCLHQPSINRTVGLSPLRPRSHDMHGANPLCTRLCCDVESTSMTLIQRRNKVVCQWEGLVFVIGISQFYHSSFHVSERGDARDEFFDLGNRKNDWWFWEFMCHGGRWAHFFTPRQIWIWSSLTLIFQDWLTVFQIYASLLTF